MSEGDLYTKTVLSQGCLECDSGTTWRVEGPGILSQDFDCESFADELIDLLTAAYQAGHTQAEQVNEGRS